MSIEPDYPLLNTPGWHDLLERHHEEDPAGFVLRFGGKKGWPVREIAEQLHCYPRAEAKLGPLHKPEMIYLREALEQASGYAVATWRARTWMRKTIEDDDAGNTGGPESPDSESLGSESLGSESPDSESPDSESPGHEEPLIADLTGGLGIDTAAFALAGAKVHYCERNEILTGIARHNHKLLGISDRVTWFTGDAMEWLASWSDQGSRKLDLVYVDPSRRRGEDRVITISQSEPDISAHLDLLRAAASCWLIKLSPMLDPVEIMRSLPDCTSITAVSVGGEMKELLAECRPEKHSKQSVGRPPAEKAQLRAVILDKAGEELYQVGVDRHHPEYIADGVPAVPAGSLLFEPDPSILKMKLIDQTARRYGLSRIHPDIGYLTNGEQRSGPERMPATDFPGKLYRIHRILPYKPRKLKRWLSDNGLTKVHLHQRGFPLTVEQLYRKLGCSMGDQAHLFATPAHDGQYVIIIAEKLHPDFMYSPEYPIMSENPS